MSYTKQDLNNVFNYNKSRPVPLFHVSARGRMVWDIRNMDKDFFNQNLSRPVQTLQDLTQLKNQVKKEMEKRGMFS